jgi:hypothetical protein
LNSSVLIVLFRLFIKYQFFCSKFHSRALPISDPNSLSILIMHFVPKLLATLTLGTVLGVTAAPVDPSAIEVRDARPPSHLQYEDDLAYRKG